MVGWVFNLMIIEGTLFYEHEKIMVFNVEEI
jgi:hypothetical protein